MQCIVHALLLAFSESADIGPKTASIFCAGDPCAPVSSTVPRPHSNSCSRLRHAART